MASVTHRLTFNQPTPFTTQAVTAFTPGANELLGVWLEAYGTVAAGAITDDKGIGFTKVSSALFNTSADTFYFFIANNLAAAVSTILTIDVSSDQATSAELMVFGVSGMTRTGLSAIRQSTKKENQPSSASPISSPLFGVNCLTGNPTVEGMGSTETGMTPPTNWTEGADAGGLEYHFRNSGFTGTNIGWNDTVATAYCIQAHELDTSAASTFRAARPKTILQAVNRAGSY